MNYERVHLLGNIGSEKHKGENIKQADRRGKDEQRYNIFSAHPYAEKCGGYIYIPNKSVVALCNKTSMLSIIIRHPYQSLNIAAK